MGRSCGSGGEGPGLHQGLAWCRGLHGVGEGVLG